MQKEWSKEVFSRNLQSYMDRSGKSQKELAEIVGVTAPTFHEWVKGKKYPRIDKIQKLADYFGILKSDLIEEKLTEEKEKDNDILADIIVRLRTDSEFCSLVKTLYQMESADIKRYQAVLNALSE